MSAVEVFYDTNVVLYLLSEHTAKADRANSEHLQRGQIFERQLTVRNPFN